MKFNPKVSLAQLRAVKGTDYQKWSPTRRNLVFIEGKMFRISNPLSKGNSKLDKGILIFDLLAVITCMNCADCRKACYALKSQRQYPATFNKRLINTLLVLQNLPTLESLIRRQLLRSKERIVRIHSSGDFINQAYLNMWCRIAREFPDIRFYSYTKVDHLLDFTGLDVLPNVNIVRSILPDGCVNFGSVDYCNIYPFPVCPVTNGDTKAKCGVTCKLCMTKGNRYVMFVEH